MTDACRTPSGRTRVKSGSAAQGRSPPQRARFLRPFAGGLSASRQPPSTPGMPERDAKATTVPTPTVWAGRGRPLAGPAWTKAKAEGFEPGATLLRRSRSQRSTACDLQFSLAERDRSCPLRTSGSRCDADRARTTTSPRAWKAPSERPPRLLMQLSGCGHRPLLSVDDRSGPMLTGGVGHWNNSREPDGPRPEQTFRPRAASP
jgi:hypothetical protein